MTNKPIEGMAGISIDERMDLFREELKGVFARVLLQRSIEGVPGLEEVMRKYFPELFAEPPVPGKGALIKAGEVFTLSVMSVPDYSATTYVAKQDFDLRKEYGRQLAIRREEAERSREQYGDEDQEMFEALFGTSQEYGELNLECSLSDMSQRLKETGVIEAFQCRVHHLGLGTPEKRLEDLEEFFKGHWRDADGNQVPRPE